MGLGEKNKKRGRKEKNMTKERRNPKKNSLGAKLIFLRGGGDNMITCIIYTFVSIVKVKSGLVERILTEILSKYLTSIIVDKAERDNQVRLPLCMYLFLSLSRIHL